MMQHASGRQVSRRALLAYVGSGAGVFLLSACGGGFAPAPSAAAPTSQAPAQAATTPVPAAAAASQPKAGGKLVAAKLGDVANLDGHYWSPNGGLHVWLSYDTLARYDQSLTPQPQLAESWDVSSDLKQITVNLRKGVTFHSGREFNADDVIWNLTRALDPKITVGIIGGFFAPGVTFAAKDKNTVLLQSPQPWPTVFDMFHVVQMLDKENTDVASNKQTKAVGTGPFVFQEWRQGESMRFTRNPNYWQSGRPYLDEIVVNVRKDAQAMLADLESGAADLVYNVGLQDFLRLKTDANYQAQLLSPPAGFYQIQPNVKFKPLDDKRVRQALNYALDRKRIADTVLLGLVGPENLPWPANSPAFEAAKNNTYTFDLNKAKSLLGQAGVSNLTLDFVYAPTLPEYATIAQVYQADLAQIGVTLNVVSMDIAALFDSIHNQKYNGFYTLNDSWAAMEPVSLLSSGASLNYKINNAGFKDDQYSQLVATAGAEADAAKRKQMYSQLNDYILDQSFGMPIAPSTSRVITKASVHGLEFRMNDVMTFANTWMG
ncbi:MAG TPA: ABC transporter substrate-binding protein [Chloroflexota bacterium]|nr:ABC transporter substrate-binding protein [Chloroflexota bacterium]